MHTKTGGHHAAKTPPAEKQDAQPAYTGTINTYAQNERLRLLAQIEQAESHVEDVLSLSPAQRDELSPGTILAHRMRVGMVAMMQEELAALDAKINGGAI